MTVVADSIRMNTWAEQDQNMVQVGVALVVFGFPVNVDKLILLRLWILLACLATLIGNGLGGLWVKVTGTCINMY